MIKVVDFGVSALLYGDTDQGLSQDTQRQRAIDPNGLKEALVGTAPGGEAPAAGDGLAAAGQSTAKSARSSHERNLTQTGVIMGTPLYMAPELVRGAKLAQPASDMFSFGMIAYQLTAGKLPVEVPPMFMNLKPFQRFYTPLSVACPDLPEHIGGLIERCLDPAPENRPTATELVKVLQK